MKWLQLGGLFFAMYKLQSDCVVLKYVQALRNILAGILASIGLCGIEIYPRRGPTCWACPASIGLCGIEIVFAAGVFRKSTVLQSDCVVLKCVG